jgi:hypothetical protein
MKCWARSCWHRNACGVGESKQTEKMYLQMVPGVTLLKIRTGMTTMIEIFSIIEGFKNVIRIIRSRTLACDFVFCQVILFAFKSF